MRNNENPEAQPGMMPAGSQSKNLPMSIRIGEKAHSSPPMASAPGCLFALSVAALESCYCPFV